VTRRLDATIHAGNGRVLARRPVLELRAAVRPGDSGAPLVGRDGTIAGVVFARSTERTGIAYAVDAAVLAALLR
jgi:S1-C subfamily serine protease